MSLSAALLLVGFALGAAVTFLGCWFYAHRVLLAEVPLGIAREAPHAAIHARFGESLILDAVRAAPQLEGVYVAYLSADGAQRRQCSVDERMFYDACLGGALRQVVDAYRTTHATLHDAAKIPQRSKTTCH